MKTPTRIQVLTANEAIRRGNARKPTRLDSGEVEFRIPTQDMPVLARLFPDLVSKDAAARETAWRDLRRHPVGEKYLVVRTPNQVQRSNRNRIIVR